MIINQPRGDMSGWDEYENPLDVDDGIKLASGHFVQENSLVNRNTLQANPLDYSWQNPIRNIYASNRAENYDIGSVRNYGYGEVYSNPELQRHIARVSSETQVPGRWIADSLALVTHGTFSPYNETGGGAFGFVAKRPDEVMTLGVNPLMYSRGDLTTQMDAVSRQLQKSQVGQYGAEYVFTSLLNPELAQKLYEKPRLASALNNGLYTLEDMWNALGSHQDMAYSHALNTRRIVSNQHKHDSFNPQCAWCLSLAQSKSDIVPHEFQDAYNF